MRRCLLFVTLAAVAALATPRPVSAQNAAGASPEEPQLSGGVWKLETIELKDGKTYRGLLQARSERQIDFAEIVQPPGKPTYAMVRGIEPAQVARIERLPDEQRRLLAERFRQLRYRAMIEAGRMEEVRLREETRGGKLVWVYDGDWFTLASTADDESTRRCVVRIEQVFRAFRTLLPPRAELPPRLAIELYASQDEFRQVLRSLELEAGLAAFYLPRQSRIVAASELSEFARRLKHVRGQAQGVMRRYDELERELAARLAALSGELKAAGFTKDEITAELTLRRSVFQKEKETALLRTAELMRQNEARFNDVTKAMFRRLYHEALHAYLDNVVFPVGEFHVPRWLHEGLAQVFEGGQLEGDSLRLDAADPEQLALLQADLRGGRPLPLAELLVSEGTAFRGSHDDVDRRRHYLYAWGLTQHLVFHGNLLSGGVLQQYVGLKEERTPAIERFERLIQEPLPVWEAKWRAAMLVFPPPAR